MPGLNRFFHAAIGGEWMWLAQRQGTLAQWRTHVERPAVETWVLSDGGVPAGYVEFEGPANGVVEIEYPGLPGAFIGCSLARTS